MDFFSWHDGRDDFFHWGELITQVMTSYKLVSVTCIVITAVDIHTVEHVSETTTTSTLRSHFGSSRHVCSNFILQQ